MFFSTWKQVPKRPRKLETLNRLLEKHSCWGRGRREEVCPYQGNGWLAWVCVLSHHAFLLSALSNVGWQNLAKTSPVTRTLPWVFSQGSCLPLYPIAMPWPGLAMSYEDCQTARTLNHLSLFLMWVWPSYHSSKLSEHVGSHVLGLHSLSSFSFKPPRG